MRYAIMIFRALGLIGIVILVGSANAQDHLKPNPWATQSKVTIDYGPQPPLLDRNRAVGCLVRWRDNGAESTARYRGT
jgi:hypothetical protein